MSTTCLPLLLSLVGFPSLQVPVHQDAAASRSTTWVDFDGDGNLDLYVLDASGSDHVFRNEGEGELAEVTLEVGLGGRVPARSGAWADFDQDGRPDLLRELVGGGFELLHAGPLFEDRTGVVAGVEGSPATHVEWCDPDSDGWPDLFMTVPRGALFLRNRAGSSFEPTTPLPIALPPIAAAAAGDRSDPSRAVGTDTEPTPGHLQPPASSAPAPARSQAVAPPTRRRALVTGSAGPPTSGAPSSAGAAPLLGSAPCARTLRDEADNSCLSASSLPELGKLFPLSAELNVSAGGNVGVGTTSPSHRLTVSGTSPQVLRLDGPGANRSRARLQFGAPGGTGGVYIEETVDDALALRAPVGTAILGGKVTVGSALTPSHRMTITDLNSENALRLIGPGVFGSSARLNFGDRQFVYLQEPFDDVLEIQAPAVYANEKLSVGVPPQSTALPHALTVRSTDFRTLHLQGPGLNESGAQILFGDPGLVTISEPTDDLLRIHAQGGTQVLGGNLFVGLSAGSGPHTLTVDSEIFPTALSLRGPDAFGAGARIDFGDDFGVVSISEDLDDRLKLQSGGRTLLSAPQVQVGPEPPAVTGRLVVSESNGDPVLRLRGHGIAADGASIEFGDSDNVSIQSAFELLLFNTSNGVQSDPITIYQKDSGATPAGLRVFSGSFPNKPHVLLDQQTAGNYARLRMTVQDSANYWDVAAGGTANELNFFAAGVGNVMTLRRASGGGVGIGTSNPAGFKLAVNGSAAKPGGGAWSVLSDARLKRDVRPLEGSLATLLALRGVSYEYIDAEALGELPGRQTGFVAQEVETVVPEWVDETPDGRKFLTIRGFEARTVEALRELTAEQDAEIAALSARLAEQDARLERLETQLARLAERTRRD